MLLADLLEENGNDLENHDLAALADWAYGKKHESQDSEWKRAYALIREGSDLLLRRRVRLSGENAQRAREQNERNTAESSCGTNRRRSRVASFKPPSEDPQIVADKPESSPVGGVARETVPIVNSADFVEKDKTL